VKEILIEGEIGRKGGKFALDKVQRILIIFWATSQVVGSSQVVVKKNLIEEGIGGKRRKVCPSLKARGQ